MSSKQFVVLGLCEGHLASACIMIDGAVVAASHEERYTRLKNDMGMPVRAARFCMEQSGVAAEDVDAVAIVNTKYTKDGIATILFKRMAVFDREDYVEENRLYWRPKLVENSLNGSHFFDVMGGWDRVHPDQAYDLGRLDMSLPDAAVEQQFNELRRDAVQAHLGISANKVQFVKHFLCHHYHAYYSGHLRGDDVVVVHAEGFGEDYNQAVSVPGPEGLTFLAGTNQFNIGRLYQWMTLLLGMKPYSHEYKLMGLAPHANAYEISKARPVFERVFDVDADAMTIGFKERPSDLYFHFRDALEGLRFDGIAGALQAVTEDCLSRWVDAVIAKTGRTRVAYGGGVAMNVKANMVIGQSPAVDDLFVPLSPGDESNVMGAAYFLTEQHMIGQGRDPDAIPPLASPYLGNDYGDAETRAVVEERKIGHVAKAPDPTQKAADLLAAGRVVARFQGRSEFGQRALGDRSILANPATPSVIEKINRQIKYRDFWMPFAPSVLDECFDTYVDNPKNLDASYMTIAFDSRPDTAPDIVGALHPADATARPHRVRADTAPGYHALIGAFRERTGTGTVLNTSMNLHGEPIAESPEDALHVFEESELDCLWIGDQIVVRNESDA